jgi:predicted RNA polymerase sigma factor
MESAAVGRRSGRWTPENQLRSAIGTLTEKGPPPPRASNVEQDWQNDVDFQQAEDAEVLGLLALMEIQALRHRARTGPDGAFIPLTEQDRARWDHLLIRRGLDALARAEALGGPVGDWGPYVLQASLAACHARARRAAETDWPRIAALYDRLRVVAPSPVVDLNRAIAHCMAFGPEAGLQLVDEIDAAGALRHYAPLPAARGDFLFRAGRLAEARSEFKAAATLTRNARERAFLLARADACDSPG